jgi:hypothetical protein
MVIIARITLNRSLYLFIGYAKLGQRYFCYKDISSLASGLPNSVICWLTGKLCKSNSMPLLSGFPPVLSKKQNVSI